MSKERIQGVTEKVYKGIKYRSTLEADTAEVLDLLGLPFEYEKKRITLLESFKCPFQKDKVRAIHYTPDFTIGPIILECKGFETPEWRNKKKYVFKYLMENEPAAIFYQIKNCGKQLLQALDNHWTYLGYAVKVTSKPMKKKIKNPKPESQIFDSVQQAIHDLNLGKEVTSAILKSMMGKKEYVYGYKWKLIKINL
jgi:hypothetical protein